MANPFLRKQSAAKITLHFFRASVFTVAQPRSPVRRRHFIISYPKNSNGGLIPAPKRITEFSSPAAWPAFFIRLSKRTIEICRKGVFLRSFEGDFYTKRSCLSDFWAQNGLNDSFIEQNFNTFKLYSDQPKIKELLGWVRSIFELFYAIWETPGRLSFCHLS